jgi:hypothetical protein
MDSHANVSEASPQPCTIVSCAAKAMGPAQRQGLAVKVLAGTEPICAIARQERVSRKFLYQQATKAEAALQDAFSLGQPDHDEVLFYLPVTKAWIEQLVVGLALDCHSSVRGVLDLFEDVFDWSLSVGKVQSILHGAMLRARPYNARQDLSQVRIGAHDELFQAGWPVLVGADVDSTYCYLLSLEDQRDGETWALRLMELQDRGFDPEATIADAGSGLRAGQTLAMPGTPCRGDVFHALQTVQPLVSYLENRAYEAIADRSKLEGKRTKKRRQGQPTHSVGAQWGRACRKEAQAVALADDVAMLARWLGEDILSLAGPDYATRCALYDFVVAELRARQPLCPHRIGPVVRALENQRGDLLAFAAQLDWDLEELAAEFQIAIPTLRALFNLQTLDTKDPARWFREAAFRRQLGPRFFAASEALAELAILTTRASSVIENLNSRLRAYFFLRRHLGPDYLALLQFFLNHRRFRRSQRPERVGKSPAELLTQQAHPHWLEMLGYTRFSRN